MNAKTTLAILLIAVALGAYLYLVEQRPDTDDDPIGPTVGKPAFADGRVDAEAVDTLTITVDGERSATFTKRDGKWAQTEPVAFDAIGPQVDALIDAVAGLRYTSTLDPAEKPDLSLKRLGLEPPQRVVRLAGADLEPVTVALGRKTAAGQAYAIVGFEAGASKQKVQVVGQGVHDALGDEPIAALRSRSLPTVSAGGVDAATLARGDAAIKLTRTGGDWALTEPVAGRANRDAVAQLLGAFSAARIEKFVTDEPGDLSVYGLDKPTATLSATLAASTDGGATTHTLLIGNATDLTNQTHFAMLAGRPIVFTLGKPVVDRLAMDVDTLRDPRLVTTPRGDLTAVTIKRADAEPVALRREGGSWAFAEPAPPFKLDAGLVAAALDALFNAAAQEYVDLSNVRLKAPIATVEISAIGRDTPATLNLHDREDGTLLAVLDGEPVGRVVTRPALDPLLQPAIGFRDRVVIPARPDDVRSIKLERTGAHAATYTLERTAPQAQGPSLSEDDDAPAPGAWKLDGLDRQNVNALIGAVAPLVAQRWTGHSDEPIDADVTLTITLATGDGTEPRVIRLASGAKVAQDAASGDTFVPMPALVAAATAELRDPVVLAMDIAQIASVSTHGVTVKRDEAGRFTLDGDDAARLDEAKAAALFDAVANLRAERYLPELTALDGAPVVITATLRDGGEQRIEVFGDAKRHVVTRAGAQTPFVVNPAAYRALTSDPRLGR